MHAFEFYAPTRIVFGKGSIERLSTLVSSDTPLMLLYGGGSIRKNGVYDAVLSALPAAPAVIFGGIEPNPDYETCLKAVAEARRHDVGFVLAVGGGSVLDAAKFIAAAVVWQGDPWDIFADRGASVADALPLGDVLTLPATGSEMNKNSVISRRATTDKVAFMSPHVFPRFSILDPETTFSLPPRQTANGIVDACAHVFEQYMTYPVNAPLQDRQAEAVLLTLIEEGPKALKHPSDYDVRANIMWAATCALNGSLSCGVPGDWSTHMIGHELTALYGIDHAQSLAVVMPGVWRHQREAKRAKLLQYARRVWKLTDGTDDERIEAAIVRTEAFFTSLGVGVRLSDYGIGDDAPQRVARNQGRRNRILGEHENIGTAEIKAILETRR